MSTNPLPPDDSRAAEARTLLAEAQRLHKEGKIDAALSTAQQALEAAPTFTPALTYIGTTLITRRLQFQDGIDALERALAIAPEDPGVQYSAGWCYEFVAYRLEKQGRKPYRDPVELYELAIQHLQRCIDLNPEQGLKDDAQDLMDSIKI